jgi:hypothetical protein
VKKRLFDLLARELRDVGPDKFFATNSGFNNQFCLGWPKWKDSQPSMKNLTDQHGLLKGKANLDAIAWLAVGDRPRLPTVTDEDISTRAQVAREVITPWFLSTFEVPEDHAAAVLSCTLYPRWAVGLPLWEATISDRLQLGRWGVDQNQQLLVWLSALAMCVGAGQHGEAAMADDYKPSNRTIGVVVDAFADRLRWKLARLEKFHNDQSI